MSKFSRLESSDSNLITGDKTYLSAIKVLGKKYFDNNDIYSCAKEIKLTSDTLSEYKVAKPFALDAKGTKFLKNVEKLKDEYEKFLKDVEKACNEYEASLTGSKEEFVNGALETVNMLLPGVVPATVLNPASSVNPLETVDLLMPGVVPDQLLSDEYILSKYTDQQLADMVIAGKFGAGDARKKALGSRYDGVQKIVNQKMNGNSKGSTNGGTQKAATNTTTKESSTGATTTKSGTSSELEKKLKAKEEQLEQAEMEKKKADIAKTEAQDKANRAAAEKQEEEKRRHMAEAEAENAKEEATKLKTENEELKKKLEKTDTPSEVTPQTEPKPEVTPEPTPAEQPKPASEPAPAQEPAQTQPTSQPQKQVYTQPSVQKQTSSTEPVVEIKPNEQIKIEPVTPTEQPTETTTEKPSTTPLPNPNAGDTETGTGSSSKSSGSSVVPIAVGLGAAVAGGIGIKAIHDHKKNSKFDDQNEDSVTNGNRFWTDEDPNVMHTEEDLFNENIDTNDVSYQAVENNSVTPDLDTNINNDTWSIEEDEIKDNNTFDLLSENN